MNKVFNKKISFLLGILSAFDINYNFDFDNKYLYDPEVIDCQFKMYMLLFPMSEEEQDKRYKEFEEVYNKLSKEKQEYIKEDFRKILEEQDKNNKEKEKIL